MAIAAFLAGAVISLGTSWVLVTRLERLGERIGFSEALLGLLAALAADTPEITSAVTALAHHEQAVGSGVVTIMTVPAAETNCRTVRWIPVPVSMIKYS